MNELQEQYRLLDVPADVSLATLKQAYKDLVLVWHPDRFSDHPRLQKKAEEKLKCINLAYKELRALCRQGNSQRPPDSETRQNRSGQYRYQGASRSRSSQHRTQTAQQTRHRTCSPKSSDSGIAFSDAYFIVSHFHFRAIQRADCDRKYFKSGPFTLEINTRHQQVTLENLCDSINGFHPILLTIPCKASGVFTGSEAQELMVLFKKSQGDGI